MLSISNLHVSIGDKSILNGLTLDIPAGEGEIVLCYVAVGGELT